MTSSSFAVSFVGPHIFIGADAWSLFDGCGASVRQHSVLPTREALEEAAGSSQAIITWGQIDVACAAALVETGLELLVLLSTGFEELIDDVALAALTSGGTTVCYTPGYATAAVAEFAMCSCLSLRRRLIASGAGIDQGMGPWLGSDFYASTAGIVGLGRIGVRIAELCSALGAKAVLGASRTDRPTRPVELVSLDVLCTRADSIFFAAGLNGASRGMFRGEHIALLPAGAVVVNIARPQLMDPASTRTALLDRRDVRVLVDGDRSLLDEPDWASLYELDNVEWTPHAAFNTLGALERCTAQAAEAVAAYCGSEPLDGHLATAPQRSG